MADIRLNFLISGQETFKIGSPLFNAIGGTTTGIIILAMICAFVWLQKSKEQFRIQDFIQDFILTRNPHKETVRTMDLVAGFLFSWLTSKMKLEKEKAKKEQNEGKTSKLASFSSMSHFRKTAGQLSGLRFWPSFDLGN